MMRHANCRVCDEESPLFFDEGRPYFKCSSCGLIFTDRQPSEVVATRHYKSQWEEKEPGFWKNQVDILLTCAKKYIEPVRILDFGSGNGDILAELVGRGYDAFGVDPLVNGFLKDQCFDSPFDLVIGVEVIEHLPNLWDELHELRKVVAPHGIMIFSTLLTNPFVNKSDSAEHFKNWWYKDDPTHVNFFSNSSLLKLAEIGNYAIDIYGDNVFVLGREG